MENLNVEVIDSFFDIDTIYLTELSIREEKYVKIGIELDGDCFADYCFHVLSKIKNNEVEHMTLTYVTSEGMREEIESLNKGDKLWNIVLQDMQAKQVLS